MDLGSVLESELGQMEIWCVKGMCRLKLVSSENNSVFKRLMNTVGMRLVEAQIGLNQGCIEPPKAVREHATLCMDDIVLSVTKHMVSG